MEVQGLLQRRSVSSVLQSRNFRRSLENIVRSRLQPAGAGRSVATTAGPRATESSDDSTSSGRNSRSGSQLLESISESNLSSNARYDDS